MTEPDRPASSATPAALVDRDLRGARFERLDVRGSSFSQVELDGSTLRRVRFSDGELRGALLRRTRLLGVELHDVEITGELVDVTVNGVEIGPLVEAELNRRMPDRVKMRPTDADGFREAWALLERLWAQTVAAARELPPEQLHESVRGEWSFVQTLRHLNFAIAAWVGRMILGDPTPWHPLDLPWDEAPDWPELGFQRDIRPDLDDVLAVRAERQAMVRDVMETLTDEQLASEVSCTEPGWPQVESFPFRECLLIVLNEEWEHRLFAERDLAALAAS